jgi:hypothetical protein
MDGRREEGRGFIHERGREISRPTGAVSVLGKPKQQGDWQENPCVAEPQVLQSHCLGSWFWPDKMQVRRNAARREAVQWSSALSSGVSAVLDGIRGSDRRGGMGATEFGEECSGTWPAERAPGQPICARPTIPYLNT